MVKKQVGAVILLLALVGGGFALLLPRVDAQQAPAKAIEIERFQRELIRKLDGISRDLTEIQRKLVRMDRKLDSIESSIK